jgi:hypothetical protein
MVGSGDTRNAAADRLAPAIRSIRMEILASALSASNLGAEG